MARVAREASLLLRRKIPFASQRGVFLDVADATYDKRTSSEQNRKLMIRHSNIFERKS
jgi:hypothetical protein